MPTQTFQPQEVVAANPERIQVPTSSTAVANTSSGGVPPSLVTVFAKEAWKRKNLMIGWGIVTAALIAVVVLIIAKPLYRAEGKLAYRPNYSRGAKPIYTPPNIQSAVQILKSPDVLEPVRAKHVPGMSKDEFGQKVRIEVSKQSEFIDVGFDHPNPAIAAAVANDLMTEGLKFFADVRTRSMKDAVRQVTHDLKTARAQLEAAKDDYRKAHESRGVADPEVEQEALRTSLTAIETQLRAAREKQASMKLEIKFLEARRDAPADTSEAGFDEHFFPILQTMMNELQTKLSNGQNLESAKIKLQAAKNEEANMRPLVAKNILSRLEYDKIVSEIRLQEASIKQAEELSSLRDDLQKRYDELKKKAASGKPVRKAVLEDLERLRKEEATLPATIAVLMEEQKQKRKGLTDLIVLKRELGEKDDNVKLNWNRVQDFHAQLTDAAERTQDLNANDLHLHSAATSGTTPYSTNAPKLGFALFGASALLFVGYLALFSLPQLAAGSLARSDGANPSLPRGLIALVPYIQSAKEKLAIPAGNPAEASKPPSSPVVQALANRIVQAGVDPGGIVLFTPTEEQLQVAPVMGDLGELFTSRGERVLVFDARRSAETPTWAGPQAADVAATVAGYLEGRAEGAGQCFVPTTMNGVEYSRADLSNGVSGVVAAHRFRQLVEEMRDRYSLVFFVGPPVHLDAGDALLATLAEGMVLVTETSADPVEIHAYLDTLCQQVPARLYGTLAVPRATI